MIEDHIRRAVERAIHDAEHPRGMGIHDGKAKIEASYLRRMLAMLDAAPTPPVQQCRDDGRCQYAIDLGAEGIGHCPPGKCVMPAQQCEPAGWLDGPYGEFRRNPAFRVTGPGSVAWSLPVFLAPTVQQDDEALYPLAMPGTLRLPEPMSDAELREVLCAEDWRMGPLQDFARAIEAEVLRRVREANT